MPVTVEVNDGKGGIATDAVTIQVVRTALREFVFEDVHFDFDRYSLRPEATRALDEAIKALQENPQLRLEVEGHTCNIGTAEYNLALGDRRGSRRPRVSDGPRHRRRPAAYRQLWGRASEARQHPRRNSPPQSARRAGGPRATVGDGRTRATWRRADVLTLLSGSIDAVIKPSPTSEIRTLIAALEVGRRDQAGGRDRAAGGDRHASGRAAHWRSTLTLRRAATRGSRFCGSSRPPAIRWRSGRLAPRCRRGATSRSRQRRRSARLLDLPEGDRSAAALDALVATALDRTTERRVRVGGAGSAPGDAEDVRARVSGGARG